MRKNRLDKKLFQREVGRQIGVEESTITNWETNRTSPSLSHIPKIIKFIGYIPCKTSVENIKMSRQLLGISQEFLAKQIGVDPGTVARWETGKGAPSKKQLTMIDQFLASLESNF